ncbi:tyrosine-type recombinase/integrase [Phycisphaerales bacterium AB-hyl4]|uniref:Tyrosine-type recombinase/integrase n=1 Tax=Natronomicrosphaera hydrolytica TaxID=3242702 RepID=A0ABV4U7Z1_9BACT
MNTATHWKVDVTKILCRSEITTVLADLKRKEPRSVNTRQNLIIFRLSTCCGLRASEIVGLNLGDLRVGVTRPYINVRRTIAKGDKARRVPLWWDAGTLADLEAWKVHRQANGASAGDPLICTQCRGNEGKRLDRFNLRKRFLAACSCLGDDRVADLTIHHGRHSFVSHALAGGRSLAEVRDAAGHSNVAITSIYTHVAVDDEGETGHLFVF